MAIEIVHFLIKMVDLSIVFQSKMVIFHSFFVNLYQAGYHRSTMNQIPSPPSRLLVHLHRLRGGGRLWLPEEVAGRLQRRNRQGAGGVTR